ncbi:MAG: AI-2E family transporter, partial [Chitinophagales bacterium]|nr:AI-2E family transporter [Chitinophagales bacterium]
MKNSKIVTYTFVLAFMVLLFLILKQLSFYLVPTVFGAFLAMLLLPLNRRMERWGIHRVPAIIFSLLLILMIVAGITTLFTSQVLIFARDLPLIQKQIIDKFNAFQYYIADHTGFGIESQMQFVDREIAAMISSADKLVAGILISTGGTFAATGLMMVHFFLFLFYRSRIKEFFLQLLPESGQTKAEHVIEQIAKVTQQYLTGVVTVMAILSVLNSLGFVALGIKNGIFFGILAAVLNIIPYIGVWIGSLLPIIMALITKESLFYPLGVLGVVLLTQFIDNNYLTPRITGSQVK